MRTLKQFLTVENEHIIRYCFILGLVAVLVYANSINNGYVLDDVMMITQNHYVQQGFAGIPKLLGSSQLKGYIMNIGSDKYRPLSLVMFAAEYQLFGLNPLVGHLINIVLYGGCTMLLFVFLVKLFDGKNNLAAFIASLLFAVHPVHTEVVANIKSRDELLCFFFAFLALSLFINYVRRGHVSSLTSGGICIFLAFLSKETVATFLGVIPLVFFAYQNNSMKRSGYIVAVTILMFVAFLLLRHNILGSNRSGQSVEVRLVFNLLAMAPDTFTRLATEILILGNYIKILIIPSPLICSYGFASISFSSFRNISVWMVLLLYLFALVFAVIRLFRRKKDPLAFAILFYLFTISIFSNIFFLIGTAFADRFAFFPSVGFCLAFGLGVEYLLSEFCSSAISLGVKQVSVITTVVGIFVFFSVITFARNADWRDNLTLMSHDVLKSPNDCWLHYYVAVELQQRCMDASDKKRRKELNAEALEHFSRSLAIYPDNAEAHADMGVAYTTADKPDSAEFHFRQALRLNPAHLNAATNLGTLLFERKRFEQAVNFYRQALSVDSSDALVWYNMGVCYAQISKIDSAIDCFTHVIGIAPQYDNYKSFGNKAILFQMLRQKDSAEKYSLLTRQYYPSFQLSPDN